MMRRMMTVLATAVLALGAAAGIAAPAMAQPEEITVLECIVGGGLPLPAEDGKSVVCKGGQHEGAPVKAPTLPGA